MVDRNCDEKLETGTVVLVVLLGITAALVLIVCCYRVLIVERISDFRVGVINDIQS